MTFKQALKSLEKAKVSLNVGTPFAITGILYEVNEDNIIVETPRTHLIIPIEKICLIGEEA